MVSAPGGVGWWCCEFLWRTQQQLMLLAIAGSQWETSWFEVKFQTQMSTKIPLESSHQGHFIGVIQIWWFLCQIIQLLSSLGIYKNSCYQRYLVPYKISILWFYTKTTMFFMTPIKSHWKELSNGILVVIGVQKLTPNHPFPLQNPGIAASDRFWPSPPRNSYCAQFGSASATTIPLIHSWYWPLVGMVSMFSFE